MGAVWSDLIGTVKSLFRVGFGRAVIDAGGLSGERTFALPDRDGIFVLSPDPRFGGQYGQAAEFDAGTSGSTKTIDFDNGNIQTISVTANCTFTLSNGQACTRYMLRLVQTSGGHTYTWPVSVVWPGGASAPTGSGAGKRDLIMFYFDGTDYFGSYLLGY